jgi:gamma-D-glutamyl-L-lysine dipeptidyl-peptidase
VSRRSYGIVQIAALDLRRRPDHRSELGTQLLLGEGVRILERRAGGAWCRVESEADGYRGWVRSWGLAEVDARRAAAWRRRARARIGALYAEAREAPGRGALVTPLLWSARVVALGRRGRHSRVALPDGRDAWVETSALAGRRPPDLVARVRSLLGVPYLWGGRTAVGIDCSGFTQLVLAERGIRVPRDAADQERRTRPVHNVDRAQAGDLVFFGDRPGPAGHVGLMLGGGYYAHARGRVRINSIDPRNPLYDKALGAQIRRAQRPAHNGR